MSIKHLRINATSIKSVLMASLLALPLLAVSLAASAQSSAVGTWKTIDDETGKAKSIVEISQAADGALTGTVIEVLQSDQGPNPVCKECKGERKDQPVKGMTIIWNMKDDGDGEYSSGTILDPSNGKDYRAKMRLIGEDKLGVSGCILFFCREQVWIRQ